MSSSQKIAVKPPWSSSGPAAAAAPSNVNGARHRRRRVPEPRAHPVAAQVEGRRVEARGEVGDLRVAELEQVVEREVDARLDVEPDDRQPPGHISIWIACSVAPGGQVDLEQQQAVGGAGEQRLQRRRLPRAVVADVDEHDGVAGLLGGALRAAQHAAEERVGDVRDDERDAAGDAGPQRAGGDVRAVAELLRGGAHRLLRARGDAPGGLAGEHERDRRLGDAGSARDVDAGDAWRSADSRHPRRTWTISSKKWWGRRARPRLLRPRDAEALLSEEAFAHDEFMPYWAELWPSALALARVVGGRALRGARALELGCGLGLPRLAAAAAGGRVPATDWARTRSR